MSPTSLNIALDLRERINLALQPCIGPPRDLPVIRLYTLREILRYMNILGHPLRTLLENVRVEFYVPRPLRKQGVDAILWAGGRGWLEGGHGFNLGHDQHGEGDGEEASGGLFELPRVRFGAMSGVMRFGVDVMPALTTDSEAGGETEDGMLLNQGRRQDSTEIEIRSLRRGVRVRVYEIVEPDGGGRNRYWMPYRWKRHDLITPWERDRGIWLRAMERALEENINERGGTGISIIELAMCVELCYWLHDEVQEWALEEVRRQRREAKMKKSEAGKKQRALRQQEKDEQRRREGADIQLVQQTIGWWSLPLEIRQKVYSELPWKPSSRGTTDGNETVTSLHKLDLPNLLQIPEVLQVDRAEAFAHLRLSIWSFYSITGPVAPRTSRYAAVRASLGDAKVDWLTKAGLEFKHIHIYSPWSTRENVEMGAGSILDLDVLSNGSVVFAKPLRNYLPGEWQVTQTEEEICEKTEAYADLEKGFRRKLEVKLTDSIKARNGSGISIAELDMAIEGLFAWKTETMFFWDLAPYIQEVQS
ncbi:Hypothetical protein D9617_3g020930 [Elsinoe fawcettii]|nr:Hypothetical protein D9617_3g020930 [Elsinoe fawcettii]